MAPSGGASPGSGGDGTGAVESEPAVEPELARTAWTVIAHSQFDSDFYADILADKGAAWVLQYGMLNFLVGDALKLALAALVVPGLWKLTR